jgi:beta-lactamase class D
MSRRAQCFLALIALLVRAAVAHAAVSVEDRPDWAAAFADADARGTIVILDLRHGHEELSVHDPERAARRYSPASTFKIPHSLFALDAGILADEFQVVRWDGVRHTIEAWNQDQDLRSAMRHSTVWVYERFARQLGERRERDYLRKVAYGNADPGGPAPFWVEGRLAISAREQVSFLRRLYRNELPFRVEHQRLVKDVMINEAGQEWILRAKTGWTGRIGWWVGWVEWPDGPVLFALNIDTPNRWDDLPKRQAIGRRILRSIGALPPAG